MAFPTLPAFQVVEGHLAVMKKGTEVIGQVLRVNPQSQSTSNQHARLGDINIKFSTGPTRHTVSIELYGEHDPVALGMLFGVSKTLGEWAGTEKIKLDPTIARADYTVEVYDVSGAAAVLEWTYSLVQFKPESLAFQIQAEGVLAATISGTLDDAYITPTLTTA